MTGPPVQMADFAGHDGLGLRHLAGAAGALAGHLGLDRREVDAGHARRVAAFHGGRHAQVHDHERPAGPGGRGLLQIGGANHRFGRTDGTDHGVGAQQLGGQPVEGDGLARHRLGEPFGAPQGAVGHDHGAHAQRAQMAGGLEAGIAGAHDGHARPGQPLRPAQELHCGRGHRQRADADPGLGSGHAPGAQGALHDALQERPGVGAGLEGGTHLAEDFGFAEDQGLEAGADAEQVPRRRFTVQRRADRRQQRA